MSKWKEHIADYLNGQLSEADRLAFEQAMKEDSNLRAEVDKHRAALNIAESFLEAEVHETLRDIRGNNTKRSPKIFNLQSSILKYAAAAAIVGGIAFGVYKFSTPSALQQRYDAAITAEILSLRTDSYRSDVLETKRDSAIEAFNTNEFRVSERLWQEIEGDESVLYRARIALREKQFDKVLDLLNTEPLSAEAQIIKYYTLYIRDGKLVAGKYFSTLSKEVQERISLN